MTDTSGLYPVKAAHYRAFNKFCDVIEDHDVYIEIHWLDDFARYSVVSIYDYGPDEVTYQWEDGTDEEYRLKPPLEYGKIPTRQAETMKKFTEILKQEFHEFMPTVIRLRWTQANEDGKTIVDFTTTLSSHGDKQ